MIMTENGCIWDGTLGILGWMFRRISSLKKKKSGEALAQAALWSHRPWRC